MQWAELSEITANDFFKDMGVSKKYVGGKLQMALQAQASGRPLMFVVSQGV